MCVCVSACVCELPGVWHEAIEQYRNMKRMSCLPVSDKIRNCLNENRKYVGIQFIQYGSQQ